MPTPAPFRFRRPLSSRLLPVTARIAGLLLAVPAAAFAGWTADVSTAVPVCAASGSQDNSVAVPDGAGGAIIAWEDARTGAPGIYVQRLDDAGNPLWTPDGVLLSGGTGAYLDAAADGSGGAFIAWVEGNLARVQRVGADGVAQWTAGGVPANSLPGDQRSPSVTADGNGGAFLAWQDYRSGWSYHIYAQHYDAAGNVQWGSTLDGRIVSASPDWSVAPQAATTPAGDLLTAWYAGGALKASCHSAVTSTSVWTLTAVVAADSLGSSSYWRMVSDGTGGMVLAFLKNPDRVYATRLDGTGTRVWTGDVPVGTLASAFPIELLESSSGGAYVAWRDTRNGGSGTLAVQHLDAAGAPQWTANGVVVDGTWCAYTGHGLAGDGSGGVVVQWQGAGGLMVQRLDASGTDQWSSGGVLLATGAGTSSRIRTVADGNGGAIAAYTWAPNAGGTDIHAEHVNADGSLGSATGAPVIGAVTGSGLRMSAYPNPFRGSTTLELAGVGRAGARVEVLDPAGRRVRTLAAEAGAERLRVVWDGRDGAGRRVPAGVYFVREVASGTTGRVVRVR